MKLYAIQLSDGYFVGGYNNTRAEVVETGQNLALTFSGPGEATAYAKRYVSAYQYTIEPISFEPKYLGWMNSWTYPTDERYATLKKCSEAKHRTHTISDGRGYNRTVCHVCCYDYEVDSSG